MMTRLPPLVVLAAALMTMAGVRASVSVSAEAAIEGAAAGGAGTLRFVLTFSPPMPAPSGWEVATSGDTAREGVDFLGVRGTVTLPAQATTAIVEVPILHDEWKEAAESLALIVWPQGGVPMPVMSRIEKPPVGPDGQSPFHWPAGPIGVSETNFIVGASLGVIEGASGRYDREWAAASGMTVSGMTVSGSGRWLALVDEEAATGGLVGGRTRLHVADRHSSATGPLLAGPPLLLPGLPGATRTVEVVGDVAAVFAVGALRVFQLNPAGPAHPLGQCLMPGAESVLFGGRRAAARSTNPSLGVQIYEADAPDLARWRLVATLPGSKRLAAFDGERLVLRNELAGSPVPTVFYVHDRHAGGADAWGETATLTVQDAEGPRPLGPVALAGSLLLVGDGAADLGAGPRPGKVHLFGLSGSAGTWSALGVITAPAPAPADGFGGRLAVAGNDLLVATVANHPGVADASWHGRLPGGRAVILDDDAAVVRVAEAGAFEPEDAPTAMAGWLTLTHPLADPITVTWRSVSATATAGQDFISESQSTVIPAGSVAASIEVMVLPDQEVEEDETLVVEITAVVGAVTDAQSNARWVIRDTNRPPVVFATQADTYEGLSTPQPEIRLFPLGSPLTTHWALRDIVPAPEGPPAWPGGLTRPGYAQAGSDYTASSGTVASSTPLTVPIDVHPVRDGMEEPAEFATLALDHDPLVTPASYGTRQVATLTGLPGTGGYSSHVTTDGEQVAIMVRLPGQGQATHKAVHLFARHATPAGGWRFVSTLRLADFGIPDDPGLDFLKLRRGRLCYYFPPTGRVWILTEMAAEPGTWALEASFASRFGPDSGFQADAEFDGDCFITSRRSGLQGGQIYIHERGAGDWGFHQDFQVNELAAPVVFDGITLMAQLSGGVAGSTDYLVMERNGFGARPWVRHGNLTIPLAVGAGSPRLHRDVMVLRGTWPAASTAVFRRHRSGAWNFEQGLMTHVIALDRGVILGVDTLASNTMARNRTFADTEPSPFRWRLLEEPESAPPPPFAVDGRSVFDACRRVIVGSVSIPGTIAGAPPVAGHFIAEPGADVRIFDSDSLKIYAHQLGFGEGFNTEAWPSVRLTPATGRLPIDIIIPYRTTTTGTATPGVDFRPVSGSVVLRAGTLETSFAVPVLPDGVLEPSEFVHIDLGPANFGTVEPAVFELEIPPMFPHNMITLPRPPVLFEPITGEQTFMVPLVMAHGFVAPVTASFTLTAGTRTGTDVVLGPGSVTIPAGHTRFHIPITVLADALEEGPEVVRLHLTALDSVPLTRFEFDLIIDDRPTRGGGADAFTVAADGTLDFSPSRSVLANDGPGGSTVAAARPPESGTVTWQPDGTFRYQPAPQFIGVDRFAYYRHVAGTSLLNATASWRWLHPLNGEDPEMGTPGFHDHWMQPAFDDTAWSTGTGLMGYGVLGLNPGAVIDTPIGTPSIHRYTAYFRTTFEGPPVPITGFSLHLACDDAVIIYLNGREIGRYAEAPDPAFFAAPNSYRLVSTNFHDQEEETEIRTLDFPSAQLLSGPNLLAISLHNQSPTSSDLGLKVTDLNTGFITHPVMVEITVTDAMAPPRVVDDVRIAPSPSTPLDSNFLPEGSVYTNDGLLASDGTPYDPILEVEIGGSPLGPVTFNKDTGHFRIGGLPSGYFGETSFTYRVRDKDGWSNTATVSVTVQPSRAFDVWRQAQFGGGSANALSMATADHDADALANLAEFAFGTDPATPDFSPIIELTRLFGGWAAEFTVQDGFGRDTVIDLEFTPTLVPATWSRLARLNDTYPSIESFATGVEATTLRWPQHRTRYSLTLPSSSINPNGFLRLRVSQERHPMDP